MKYLALGLIIPLAACSFSWSGDDDGAGASPSGTGTTRTYMVSDFSTIDLRGASDVDVRVGTGFSVRAQGPVELLDRLKIEREGDTLEIGRARMWILVGADRARSRSSSRCRGSRRRRYRDRAT